MANPSAENDAWDWPFILYVGRTWLGYTEKEIWHMTPRKFKSQLDVHYDVQRQLNGADKTRKNKSVSAGYIDQIPDW